MLSRVIYALLVYFTFGGFGYIDAPTCELGCQARILTIFADSQRKLSLRYSNQGRMICFAQFNLQWFDRTECVGYEGRPLLRSIQFEVQRGERWAILGPNGSGKTTLLRTLIGARSPLEGELEWSQSLDTGYYDQQLQDLRLDAAVLDEIRELDPRATDGELRSFLAQFLFSDEDVFKIVANLSGGEKSRLMLR